MDEVLARHRLLRPYSRESKQALIRLYLRMGENASFYMYVLNKGARKGPHLSTSSTPALTRLCWRKKEILKW